MYRPAVAMFAVATLAAVACGPAPAAPAGAPQVSSQPRQGGVLNVSRADDPNDFDTTYFGKGNGDGRQLAYESLLRFNAGPEVKPNDLQIRPELAERWEVSSDALSYTFHLRKDVKWANMAPVNGRELTADDIKFTYEYQTRSAEFKEKKLPQSQFDWMFEGLDRIEVKDRYTAVVHFKKPFVPFLSYAASDYNPIMPREIYDQDGHLRDRIAGTGPWQFDKEASQKGSRWVWSRNPTYRQAGKPYIDQVRVNILRDDATTIAAFQARQLDWLDNDRISAQTVKELPGKVPGVQIYEMLNPGGYHFHWNLRKPPLNDQRVRKAVALAIDRDELAQAEYGFKAQWSPAGALVGLFTDAEARQMLKHDVAEARRLVAEAGYPNGADLEWEFPGNRYGDAYNSRIQLIQAQLKKANINVTLKSVDPTEFSANRKIGNFQINLTASDCGDPQDFDSHIFACYHSTSKNNYAGFKDEEIDKLLEAQRAEVNPEKRREILRTAVRLINERTWGVDLFYYPKWEATQPYVKNFAPNVNRNRYMFENTWLEK